MDELNDFNLSKSQKERLVKSIENGGDLNLLQDFNLSHTQKLNLIKLIKKYSVDIDNSGDSEDTDNQESSIIQEKLGKLRYFNVINAINSNDDSFEAYVAADASLVNINNNLCHGGDIINMSAPENVNLMYCATYENLSKSVQDVLYVIFNIYITTITQLINVCKEINPTVTIPEITEEEFWKDVIVQ